MKLYSALILAPFMAAIVASTACTATVVNTNPAPVAATPGGKTSKEATTKTKDTLKTFATKTAPAGATSKGKMTKPKVGNVEVPIVDVEVFVASVNIDSDGNSEELFWATNGTSVFVWSAVVVPCSDGVGKGAESLVYATDGTDYGWLVGGDGCGWSNAYGCSSKAGGAEVCGGCAWTEDAIACEASVTQ
jgi:hypothetical protein